MARIKATELPKVARSGRVSKYADEMAAVEALLGEKDFGAGEAEVFDVDKDDLNALVSSLRKAGKGCDRKIKTVFKDGKLYVVDGGKWGEESDSAKPIRSAVAAKK